MSISEPFLLASYNSHLYASANSHNVSLAVQSDGVHVIELSMLRPIISHTLGPSTSFACAPLTVSDGHMHTIYAPIQSSAELANEQEQGRTIWVWREDLSLTIADRAAAHKNKSSVSVPHAIAGLFHVPELPKQIIALSPGGAITTLNSDELQVQRTWISQTDGAGSALLKSFIYPRSECSFLPPTATIGSGVVLVLVLADPTTSEARVETVYIASEDKESPFVLASSYRISIPQHDMLDVSCSSTGHLSILATNGEWHSFTIGPSEDDSAALAPGVDSFQLKNLQFTPGSPSKAVALLPLSSYHVLLAGISPSSTEIFIHIWDLQYSVMLISHIFSIPSSFKSSSTQTLSIALFPSLPATESSKERAALLDSQALLVVSLSSPSMNRSKSKSKSRSGTAATSIFVVPYVVPRTSTIANAMGRASASAQWMASREDDERTDETDDGVMYSGMDTSRREVLKEMRDAIEAKRPQAANDAFFRWETSQSQTAEKALVFGHDFVKQVLDVIIQPTKNSASVMYSSSVVKHLIKQKAVSTSMLEGGLVRALKTRGDWTSIHLALQYVMDINESELVEALCDVIRACEEKEMTLNPEAMEVEPGNTPNVISAIKDAPSLPFFLRSCVNYRVTPSKLRQALRHEQISSLLAPQHALPVLRVLIDWMQVWQKHDVELSAENKMQRDGSHASKKGNEVPELERIASFTEVLLDATFLTLVQHPPAQEVLGQLMSLLEQEIEFTEAIQPLCGALEEFSRAHKKALRDAAEKSASNAKGPSAGSKHQADWRQQRKRARDLKGMNIGLYQVEELVL